MSSRPSSRATAGDESTTALRSSTAKRPVTRPVAPRLSTSSSATRPTSRTTARTSTTTTPSSLNKPPTRPTVTSSTVKRPPSSASNTASSLHRARPSSASVEASGDESKRDGITARPKRMSLASAASTERPSATGRATAATPARKPSSTSTSTTSTARSTVRSPTSTMKSAPAAARPTSSLASRTRPVSMSAARTAPSLADKKRLSTIPASPAVRGAAGLRADKNEEDGAASESEKLPVRPALGTRKSTRSVLIEQRIDEFELVNQMLRSAMTADGMDSDEDQHIQDESKATMAKLRADLAKVRAFEKEHGRLPTEAELAEVEDVPPEGDDTSKESAGTTAPDSETTGLKEQLEESRGQVEELKSHLSDMKARMEYFGKDAEEPGEKVLEATESIRSEHAAKIEEMQALLESQKEELKNSYETKIDEAAKKHADDIKTLKDLHDQEFADKDAELVTLRADLEDTKITADAAVAAQEAQTMADPDNSELVDVREQLKAIRERHSAAKENAKLKMAKVLEDYRKEISAMKNRNEQKIAELQEQLDKARSGAGFDDGEITREKEAHAQTLQQLQAVRDEAKKSRDADSEKHLRVVKDLRHQLTKHERSRVEEAEKAESLAAKLKKESDQQLQEVRAQLRTAQGEVRKSKERNEKHSSEVMQKLERDLKDAQNQLADTTSTIDESKKAFEVQLDEAKKAAESAAALHKEEMNSLRQQLDAATQSSESKNVEQTEQLASLQAQLTAKAQEIEGTKTAHAEALSKAQTEASTANNTAIELLKETHANEIGKLEEQSRSALKELEGLESSHIDRLQKLKSDAAAEQTRALDEQAATHKSTLSSLEERIAALQDDASNVQNLHDQELAKLKSEHALDKETELAALISQYDEKLAEIASQPKVLDEDIQALKDAHAGEIKQFESKAKSTAGEIDAANFQIRTLKSLIQNMEHENEQKEEERQKDLEKRDNEFSQAVQKLSSQSAKIAELETSHRQAVEQAKAAVEAETQTSLDVLKQQHDEAFDVLRKELDAKHRHTLETMRSEHSSAIDLLTKEVDTRDQSIEQLRNDHAQALADLHASSQQGNEATLAQLKTEHATALDDLRSSLVAKHEAAVKELEEKHSSSLADSSEKYEASFQQSKTEHADVVTTLRSELEQVREKLRDTSEIDTLKAQLSASQQAFSNLQEDQATTVSDMSKGHAEKISKLQGELQTLREEAKKPIDTTELDDVKAKLTESKTEVADAKAKIAELLDSHTEAVGRKDVEYANTIRKLQLELDEVKAGASAATQNATEAEEAKGLLADAKRTVSELGEQYALASMEAETQRLSAESAKKELAELKKSLTEAKVGPEPVVAEPQKISVKSPNGTAKAKPTPKAGLQASKWATAEPEEPVATETSAPSQDPDEEEGLGNGGSNAGKDLGAPQSKQRNVAGQMAGIQEHIRQMAEMNDEIFEDNRKWARSLNRVDEDGSVAVDIDVAQSQSNGVVGEETK